MRRSPSSLVLGARSVLGPWSSLVPRPWSTHKGRRTLDGPGAKDEGPRTLSIAGRMTAMTTRVLIVEDNPDIAQLIAAYLGKAGFATERSASVHDALHTIAAHP